jgi:hypothetical protein
VTIAQICKLSDEVTGGDLLEAVFIDQAIKDPTSREADRDFVLRATFPTMPLRSMVEFVADKLSGRHPKGALVVRGDYGSGKSHALLALYHLAVAAGESESWLERWKIQGRFPTSTQVALAQLVAEQPRTLWELLFERAGYGELNSQVQRVPTREQWARLASERPTLLIVDELELWFGQRVGEQEDISAALQNLLEAAHFPNIPLAVILSMYGRDPALMQTINRTQAPVRDVGSAQDRHHIIRHRLVDRLDEAKARGVLNRYVQAYQSARSEFPLLGAHLADLSRQMLETYPFHPAFLNQAFQVYASASGFQSTRGIIFLCATLLRHAAGRVDLVLAGDLDITNDDIASDLRRLDPDLVSNALEDLMQRCRGVEHATGVIGTILFHSFVPSGLVGATQEDVLVGNFRPDLNINDLQTQMEATLRQAWFVDEIEERYAVTKEVVLLKQIEQQARALINSSEGRTQAEEQIKTWLRAFMEPEPVVLYPAEPLPEALAGGGLRYVISLDPLREDEARALLQGRGNTLVLVGPRPSVRGRLTHDRELLLRAARVLVCEELLGQRTRRQMDVRQYKRRFDGEFRQALEQSYGRWMRISRTNELGEDPVYVVRPIECALNPEAIRTAILTANDLDVVKAGLQKVLRFAGRDAPRGTAQAGRTVRELREELRRQTGLPMLVDPPAQLAEALPAMVRDANPNTGVVIAVGRALYGYDDRYLPLPLSDDWRVWLKLHAPEPPAPEDVRHAVRQALADARVDGIVVSRLRADVSVRLEVSVQELHRAVAELVNEGDAVLEQGESRFPDDGHLASDAVLDSGRAWLAEFAPPDARHAARRTRALVEQSQPHGITVAELRQHLDLEGIEQAAFERAMETLLQCQTVVVERGGVPTMIRDAGLLVATDVIRLPRVEPLPPPPPGYPFYLPIGPYRRLDQFLRDLETHLAEAALVESVTFQVVPYEDAPDPLFGAEAELARIADLTVKHAFRCTFRTPTNKPGFLALARRLVERLPQAGEVLLNVEVRGRVPR